MVAASVQSMRRLVRAANGVRSVRLSLYGRERAAIVRAMAPDSPTVPKSTLAETLFMLFLRLVAV